MIFYQLMFGGKASFHEQRVPQNFQGHNLSANCQDDESPAPTWFCRISRRCKPSSRLLKISIKDVLFLFLDFILTVHHLLKYALTKLHYRELLENAKTHAYIQRPSTSEFTPHMHMCIHSLIHRYLRVCMHTLHLRLLLHRYLHVCIHTLHIRLLRTSATHINIHTAMHASIPVCMHGCMHRLMHTCRHAQMHTLTHTKIHQCMHSYFSS